MVETFKKLVELYKNSIHLLNIGSFILVIIALGFAIWLSRKNSNPKSSLAAFLSFIYPGLGHVYIRQYTIGAIYMIGMYLLIGISTPLIYVHYLFALTVSMRYVGFLHLLLVFFVWIHSIWFVNRMIQNKKRQEFMAAMYKGLHEEILEKKKFK